VAGSGNPSHSPGAGQVLDLKSSAEVAEAKSGDKIFTIAEDEAHTGDEIDLSRGMQNLALGSRAPALPLSRFGSSSSRGKGAGKRPSERSRSGDRRRDSRESEGHGPNGNGPASLSVPEEGDHDICPVCRRPLGRSCDPCDGCHSVAHDGCLEFTPGGFYCRPCMILLRLSLERPPERVGTLREMESAASSNSVAGVMEEGAGEAQAPRVGKGEGQVSSGGSVSKAPPSAPGSHEGSVSNAPSNLLPSPSQPSAQSMALTALNGWYTEDLISERVWSDSEILEKARTWLQHARTVDADDRVPIWDHSELPLPTRRELATNVRRNLAERLAGQALAQPLETLCLLHWDPGTETYIFRHELSGTQIRLREVW
jgi:hypothetical protein